METNRVKRLLKLMQTLQSGRSYDAGELSAVVGVARRTLFRDLKLLKESGVSYEFDRASLRYKAERTRSLPPVQLTHAEAFALMLAITSLVSRNIAPDNTAATSAALKIESLLPQSVLDYCGHVLDNVAFKPSAASDPRAVMGAIETAQVALRDAQQLKGKYDSYFDKEQVDVTLHPRRLLFCNRGWYLIAWWEEKGETRTFKLERFVELAVHPERASVDRQFRLDSYFGNAWSMIRGTPRCHVKVRFLAKVAANVDEVIWHKTQQTSFDSDGSLDFEVDVDGIEEISWWILGYGDQAQVIEPEALRSLVVQRARRMLAYYDGEPDGNGQSAD